MKKSNTVDIYLGNRLKIKRKEIGITQTKLASIIGISYQQVQKYEKGINKIPSGRLYELSKVLKISLMYFFKGYKEVSESNSKVDSVLK